MLNKIFDGSFMPHGHCLLWREDLLFLTLVGDGLTVIAYGIIPIALIYLVKKRKDLEFDKVFVLFAAFIAFCGLTHFVSMINIWHGYYYIQGLMKFTTGLVSITTALVLWRLMPKIMSIPSLKTLSDQNDKLIIAQENLEQANRHLEQKVQERTLSLQQLANTDQLTQVKNRRAILAALDSEYNRIQRYPSKFSLLMLDIDLFKEVNDNFGHLEGDKVLAEVASIIGQSCRQTDTVGRYGGEEFLILLPKTNIKSAQELAERICQSVADATIRNDRKITCSIGVATYKEGESIIDLIQRADERTYKAKDLGRNQVCYQH